MWIILAHQKLLQCVFIMVQNLNKYSTLNHECSKMNHAVQVLLYET